MEPSQNEPGMTPEELRVEIEKLNGAFRALYGAKQALKRLYNEKHRELVEAKDMVYQLRLVVEQNHVWHENHDPYDGYGESELCEANTSVLAVSRTLAKKKEKTDG